ncbi:MAG TPA: phage tail tip lysozyme [Candidatus Angelobacter sp.]|nr:phage tail tip lysozyme [Candidatus Angelobacter sp.]
MKKYILHLKLYSCFGLLLTTVFVPSTALAYDRDFYSLNDIIFYEPESSIVNTSSGTSSGTSTNNSSITPIVLNPSAAKQLIFQLLTDGGMNAIQASAVMGNMQAESGFNSDAHEIGNDIGYGLAQWSFERRERLEVFAIRKGVSTSDIPMQIEFLFGEYNSSYRSRLNGTAFGSGANIAEATEDWMRIFERPYDDGSNDPANLNSVRIPVAIAIYELYGS